MKNLSKLTAYGTWLYKAFFVALAFIAALPFLVLSFYSHPVADDYVFSGYYKRIGWLAFQKYFYLSWQGLYTTNAFMCSPINPVVHNRFDLYWMPCWLGVISLVVSTWLLMRYLTRDKLAAVISTSTILFVYLYQVPGPAQALFWLNANWAYQISTSLATLLLLVMLRTFQGEQVSRAYWVLAAVLTVLLIGTNFIASMLTTFAIGVCTVLNVRNRAARLWWLGLLTLACLSLAVVVLAPGNTVRMHTELGNSAAVHGAVSQASKLTHGVVHGAALAVYSLDNWLGNGVILALSVLLLPILAAVGRNVDAPLNLFFKYRFVVVLAGLAMVVLPFFPTYLTAGGPPATRVTNVAYLVFVFVWFFGLYAAVVWLRRREAPAYRQPAYLTLASGAFLLFTLPTDANHTLTYEDKGKDFNNIGLAYKDWLSGDARQFDQQQGQRYRLMQGPGHAGVLLDSLTVRPQTIYLDDLHGDSTHWANRAYAKFFGKDYVRVARKN